MHIHRCQRRFTGRALLGIATGMFLASAACAQAWPAKPVSIEDMNAAIEAQGASAQ